MTASEGTLAAIGSALLVCVCATATGDRSQGTIGFTSKAQTKRNRKHGASHKSITLGYQVHHHRSSSTCGTCPHHPSHGPQGPHNRRAPRAPPHAAGAAPLPRLCSLPTHLSSSQHKLNKSIMTSTQKSGWALKSHRGKSFCKRQVTRSPERF